MKKYFLAFSLSLVCLTVLSQSYLQSYDFVLDKELYGNLDYEASESILLTKNVNNGTEFHYKPDGSGYFSFHGWINPNLLLPPSIGELGGPTPGDNGVVGSLNSIYDVSTSGAFNYSIPIKVPVGINDLQPNISVSYSSQSSNGMMGLGWGISGLSCISRIGSTIFQDGMPKGVQFNNADHFALDGNRLYSVNGNYGNNLCEYRTEAETYNKVISYTSSNGGPDYFKLWTKDGKIIEFGNSPDSRVEMQGSSELANVWLINKISDRFGNSITFTYLEDNLNGYYKIHTIEYANSCKISFEYTSRSDALYKYIFPNKKIEVQELLSKIEIAVNNHPQYHYEFRYNKEKLNSLLTEVQLISNNGKKLNPVSFSYSGYGYGDLTTLDGIEYQYPYNGQIFTFDYDRSFFADVNGDGFQDFFAIYTWANGQKIDGYRVYFANRQHKFEFTGLYGSINLETKEYKGIYPGDLNGDGLFDFILAKQGYDKTELIPFIFNGSSFVQQTSFFIYEAGKNLKMYLADLNVDGKSELLALVHPELTSKVIFKTFSFQFNPQFQIISLPEEDDNNASISDMYELRDMDADGRPDLIRMATDGTRYYKFLFEPNNILADPIYSSFPKTSDHRVWWGDFNADGLTDTFWEDKSTHTYSINIFNGESFYKLSCDLSAINDLSYKNDPETHFRVADYNGDGFADISVISRDSSEYIDYTGFGENYWVKNFHILTLLGNGSSFKISNKDVVDQTPYEIEYDFSHMIGDFDCHGNNDYTFYTTKYGENKNVKMMYLLCTGSRTFLNKVTNEYDQELIVDYGFLADGNYIKYDDAEFPVRDFMGPVLIVEAVMTPQLQGDDYREKEYYYQGAKIDLEGKGFLGFMKNIIYDRDAKSRIITENQLFITTDYKLMLPITIESIVNWVNSTDYDLISYTENEYKIFNNYGNWGKRFAVYSTKSQIKEWSLDGEFIRTTRIKNLFDTFGSQFGNIYKTTKYISELNVDFNLGETPFTNRNELTNDYDYTYVSDWIIGRLTASTKKLSIKDESDIISISSFEYYPHEDYRFPLAFKHSINVGTTMEISTICDYSPQGILISKINRTPNYDMLDRSLLYEYNPEYNYRFLTKIVNFFGKAQNIIINEEKGTIDQTIDENGFAASFFYDEFNQKFKTRSYDGTESVYVLRWITENHEDYMPGASWYSWECNLGEKPNITIYNKLGQAIRLVSYNQNGDKVYIETLYDNFGRIISTTNPHFPKDTQYSYQSTTYDELNRPLTLVMPCEIGLEENLTSFRYGANYTETISTNGGCSKKVNNAKGEVVNSYDENGNVVSNNYYSNGLVKTSKINNNNATEVYYEYDVNCNIKMEDSPDKGTLQYEYNPYNEIESFRDHLGNVTYYDYDQLGRLIIIENIANDGASIITNRNYSTTDGKFGVLESIVKGPLDNPIHKLIYDYDPLLRIISETEIINGTEYIDHYTYDSHGKLLTYTYPNGLELKYNYLNGYLKKITSFKEGTPFILWKNIECNKFGNITKSYHGSQLYENDYSLNTNRLTASYCEGIQDFEYKYDNLGNLKHRYDNLHRINNQSLHEEFIYDLSNQLVTIIKNWQSRSISYDNLSNIDIKSDVGKYNYIDSDKPYRITSINANLNLNDSYQTPETVTYNYLNKVKTITSNGSILDVEYGITNERISQNYSYTANPNTIIKEKLFVKGGLTEVIFYYDHTKKVINYITSPEGLIAVEIEEIGENFENKEWYWIYTDNLGSITTVIRDSDQSKSEYSYDAWGKERDPLTWNPTSNVQRIIDRGYTGHEHLTEFGLINMNGRVYDPTIGRFLSPDPINQAPDCPGNYNTYSYCLNNPLKYTDPSGCLWGELAQIGTFLLWQGGKNAYDNRDPNTGQWKLDLNKCTFVIGVNFNTNFSDFTCYTSMNMTSEESLYYGYNIQNGFGYGSNPNSLYYPDIKFDIDESVINLISNISFIISRNDRINSIMDEITYGELVFADTRYSAISQNSPDPEYYYRALDNLVLPNNQVIKRANLILTFFYLPPGAQRGGNAHFMGHKNGKWKVNFSIGDYEITLDNIRTLAVHEIYGHGIKGYMDDIGHYKCYQASIDCIYWGNTTDSFKIHTLKEYYSGYFKATGSNIMPVYIYHQYIKYVK